MKYYLHTQELKLVYYAHIHSHIHYLLPIYGSCNKTALADLVILHKKSLKHIFKLPYDHPSEDVYKRGISSIYAMAQFEMILLLHKMKNGLIKSNFRPAIRDEVSNRATRQSSHFDVTRIHHNFMKNSIFTLGYSLYNKLPPNLKNEKKMSLFKSEVKKYIESR